MMDKPSPGQPLRIPAATMGAILDATNDYISRRELGEGIDPRRFEIPTDKLKLKNESGGNLALGRVLEIGASLLTEFDPMYPWFTGSTPAPDGTKGIAVALYPTISNDIDWFQVSGICYAQVNINHESQTRADVDNASTLLQSKWHGRAEILRKESTGTGEKKCLIRLGEMFRGPIEVIITAGSGISPGSSGNAKVRWAGADASPTSTITVYYDWMEGAANAGLNKEAVVWWVPDRQKYVIYELQC